MREQILIAVVLLLGCAPEPAPTELHATVLPSVGEILHPGEVYVRFDAPKTELTVYEKLNGPQLAQGSAAAGTKLAVTLGTRTCEIESAGPRVDTDFVEKRVTQETPANDPGFRTRKTTVVSVTLRCADGLPPPGIKTPPSLPGWTVVWWMLAAIALGLAVGRGWLSDNSMAEAIVTLVALAVFVVGVVLLWSRVDGGLVLSVPILALVCGASGAAAMLWPIEKGGRSKIVAAGYFVGALAGPAIVAATTPVWAGGAPLVAALIVVVWFVVFAVIGVSGDDQRARK